MEKYQEIWQREDVQVVYMVQARIGEIFRA